MRFPRRNRIDKKCNLDKNVRYRNLIGVKPEGYWYSLSRAWYDYWYIYGQLKKVTTQVVCEVTLPKNIFTTLKKREEGKILVIESVEDVKILNKEFGKNDKKFNIKLINFNLMIKKMKIKGIEFRNYNKVREELRKIKGYKNNYSWFCSIDVNSGCVWDPSILEVKTVGALKDFV